MANFKMLMELLTYENKYFLNLSNSSLFLVLIETWWVWFTSISTNNKHVCLWL